MELDEMRKADHESLTRNYHGDKIMKIWVQLFKAVLALITKAFSQGHFNPFLP